MAIFNSFLYVYQRVIYSNLISISPPLSAPLWEARYRPSQRQWRCLKAVQNWESPPFFFLVALEKREENPSIPPSELPEVCHRCHPNQSNLYECNGENGVCRVCSSIPEWESTYMCIHIYHYKSLPMDWWPSPNTTQYGPICHSAPYSVFGLWRSPSIAPKMALLEIPCQKSSTVSLVSIHSILCILCVYIYIYMITRLLQQRPDGSAEILLELAFSPFPVQVDVSSSKPPCGWKTASNHLLIGPTARLLLVDSHGFTSEWSVKTIVIIMIIIIIIVVIKNYNDNHNHNSNNKKLVR